MGLKNLGGHRTVNGFVRSKLKKLDASDGTMSSLFELMFSERENVMYEQSRGYRMEKTTYGQAYDSILRLCPSLSSALDGCPRGAAVGLYMQNSLLWIELFWAILRCGYRPLLMNSRLGDDTLEYALSSCGAAAVISDGKIFSVRTVNCADLKETDGDFSPSFADELFVMSSGTSARCFMNAKRGSSSVSPGRAFSLASASFIARRAFRPFSAASGEKRSGGHFGLGIPSLELRKSSSMRALRSWRRLRPVSSISCRYGRRCQLRRRMVT